MLITNMYIYNFAPDQKKKKNFAIVYIEEKKKCYQY